MELVVAVVVGVGLATATMVLMRRVRRGGTSTRSTGRIDPFTIGDPWRRHVAAAQSAQRRFVSIVTSVEPGPLRTRLAEIGRQVDRGVDECWQIARRGDQLDETIRQLDGAALQVRHDRASDEGERSSLRSQIDSVDRIRAAREQTDARLRGLHTRLGELVSHAAEVSISADLTAELGSAVDDVVTQLEALNQAVDEVNNTGRSRGFETGGPGTTAPTT